MIFGMVDDRARAGARPRGDLPGLFQRPATVVLNVHGIHRPGSGLQLAESGGQILGVDFFVGRLLVAHGPAHGGRGRGADEEELVALGQVQVLFLVADFGVGAEVDSGAVAEDGLAVEDLADLDGVLDGVEGDDDAAEGFERGEDVDCGVFVDGGGDGFEDLRGEDVEGFEVCDEEGVAGRCWL